MAHFDEGHSAVMRGKSDDRQAANYLERSWFVLL